MEFEFKDSKFIETNIFSMKNFVKPTTSNIDAAFSTAIGRRENLILVKKVWQYNIDRYKHRPVCA